MLDKKKLPYFVSLIFTIYLTHNWISFFYNPTNNSDFDKYFHYIEYFSGLNVQFDFGQGVVYYYLVYLNFSNYLSRLNITNTDTIIGNSIVEVNSILFFFGLIGIYKLLKLYNYKFQNIILSLVLLNFFPQMIYMRSVMKPEILTFALFSWILFLVEKAKKTKNVKNLYLMVPFASILLNTKASLAGMFILFFLFFYLDLYKIFGLKVIFTVSIILILNFGFLIYENIQITENNYVYRIYDSEFDNKADWKILFNFNFQQLIKDPFFETDNNSIHANSVIQLTLLDSFGDHFNQLIYEKRNYFSQNVKDVFVSDSDNFLNENRQILYKGPFKNIIVDSPLYFKKLISIFMSIFFYSFLIYFAIIKKFEKQFFLGPFIGILILYINSLGFPSNNFNPVRGDTFKSFYYSFLLSVAFVFIIVNLFSKTKVFYKFLFCTTYIVIILFIFGHPKSISQEFSNKLIIENEYNIFCSINNFIFFNENLIGRVHESGIENNINSDCKNKKLSKNENNNSETFFIDVLSRNSCEDTEFLGNDFLHRTLCRYNTFELIEKNNINSNTPPYFNLITIIACLSIIIYQTKRNHND